MLYPVSLKRIPLVMQDELDKGMSSLKKLGMEMGFTFPEVPPEATVMGPAEYPNHLCYKALPSFPLPSREDLLDGIRVSEVSNILYF